MLEVKKPHTPLEDTKTQAQHSELLLREVALSRISSQKTENFSAIAKSFGVFEIFVKAADVKDLTLDAINSATQHTHWTTDKKINMGYYTSPKSFYTPFFHETSHLLLTNLGRPPEAYVSHHIAEENFCWNFAKDITQISRLPFSREHAEISKEFVDFSSKAIQDPVTLDSKFHELLEKERVIKGFSEANREEVVWTADGRPVLKKE